MQLKDFRDLLLLGTIWSGSFLFMVVAIHEVGPLPLIEIRSATGALFLLALVISMGKFPTMLVNWKRITLVGLFNSAIPFLLLAYASHSLTAGLMAVMNAMTPIFGSIIARWWLNERMTVPRILGLLLGFSGVIVLVSDDLRSGTGSAHILSLLGALGAPLCYALATCYSSRYLKEVDPVASAAGSISVTALLFLPLAIVTWPQTPVSITSWSAALALGVLCTGVAYALFYRLIANVGASRATTVTFLVPPLAIIWGVLILNEPLTPTIILGTAIVLLGTFLATGARFGRRRPRTAPVE